MQEALVPHWYFHWSFVQELMPRLVSVSHFLIKWLEPQEHHPCPSCLSARLPSATAGELVGEEGWRCLAADVTPLLGIQLGMALICLPLLGRSSTWKSTVLPPPTASSKPCSALGLHHVLLLPAPGGCGFVTEGEPASCLLCHSAWLTSRSVLLLSLPLWQTDEWDYLAEGGFFFLPAPASLVAALERGRPFGSERNLP